MDVIDAPGSLPARLDGFDVDRVLAPSRLMVNRFDRPKVRENERLERCETLVYEDGLFAAHDL